MRILMVVLMFLTIAVFPFCLYALDGDEDQGLNTLAVQNRQHSMSHEFGVWIGALPMDAFTKGLTFTGAYTFHFNDIFAWEIGQFTYSYGIDTDLVDELESLSTGPTPFEVVKHFATSSFMFKPVYGKMALLNRALIYGEVFILAGAGYGWMTITNRPVIDVGVGGRIYAGKYVSFRLDVREYMFINLDDLHDELWVALSICLGLG
ncbi:MAG: outer membrane beta-barrel domain-containing protein [Proteobacteria bacterium]|nr:outer membrane beta-barrel domain-containing protein [Pseudomonadota bacterium]